MATRFVRGEYEDFESLKHALKTLKESRVRSYEAYGPTNLKDVEDLMPQQFTPVRGCSTFGAIAGLIGFYLLSVYASITYHLIVGGKPPISNVPFVIPSYEGTILLGGIAAFLAVLLIALLYPRRLPAQYSPAFSGASYGIVIRCGMLESGKMADLLRQTGAKEVSEC